LSSAAVEAEVGFFSSEAAEVYDLAFSARELQKRTTARRVAFGLSTSVILPTTRATVSAVPGLAGCTDNPSCWTQES